ncbi:MAG: hypothetical protein KME42_14135 [Tildeniella nuda ZEHNDER 1965/U140]|jgi:hypothetical protein|nr:hypothetical protein [Tildeniella nuda ZEHNDER 1965/U140]
MNNLSELAASNLVATMGQIAACMNRYTESPDCRNLEDALLLSETLGNLSEAIAQLKASGLVEEEAFAVWVARVGLMVSEGQ